MQIDNWVYAFKNCLKWFVASLIFTDSFIRMICRKSIRPTNCNSLMVKLLRIYVCVSSLIEMLILCYYETQITSLVTTPAEEKPFQTLTQLFNESYKMLIVPNSPLRVLNHLEESDGWRVLRKDFELHGVSDKLSRGIVSPNIMMQSYENYFNMYFIPLKLAYATLNSLLNFDYDVIKSSVPTRNSQCFIMPTKLYNTMNVYQIQMLSRYLYKKSFLWLDQSGLQQLWDDWSQSGDRLQRKLKYSKRSGRKEYSVENIDSIKIEKMLAALYVVTVLFLAACTVFAIEYMIMLHCKFRFLSCLSSN